MRQLIELTIKAGTAVKSPTSLRASSWCAALLIVAGTLLAPITGRSEAPSPCNQCAEWNVPQQPFRIYGNTYYVGVHGLSSILITSPQGHILIDGALPESAPKIVQNIQTLGFRVQDVKLILNTHVHFDHAGGIAELQRLSGASVAASEPSAPVLRTGRSGKDDPQFGRLPSYPAVHAVRTFKDGETLHVGPTAMTAHLTPGHTRGGTTWTWKSCEQDKCLNLVYADSLTALSADGFLFTRNDGYPNAVSDFQHSFATVSALPCDILLTPHPEASGLWDRLEKRDHGGTPDALVDTSACRKYADRSRQNFEKRIAQEQAHP